MPELVFMIVAHGHSVDAQTNQLSIFGLFEAVAAPEFPIAVPEVTVANMWRRNEGEENQEFSQRIRLLGPKNEVLFTFDSEFCLTKPRHRILGRIAMLPFMRAGAYRFDLSIKPKSSADWPAPMATYPVDVEMIPADSPLLAPTIPVKQY